MYRALPGPDDIVQGRERLFNGRVGIESMDLIEIDVIEAKPPERSVDGVHQMCFRDRPRAFGPSSSG